MERWAYDVATVVEDVAQGRNHAYERGEWEEALRKIRKALTKEGARANSYLRRLAAECAFSLGAWPSALKYAREAVTLGAREPGGGFVRALCLQGDAHLCMGEPMKAWDLYERAAAVGSGHPLPSFYFGQALLLVARLLDVYGEEQRRSAGFDQRTTESIDTAIGSLADRAIDDLTEAADLLDQWGLNPESYQSRDFHLVPTLLGQGMSYLLARAPGPAASRIQSARRIFPRDDLCFREFLFAKCWEQGLHRRFGEMVTGDEWKAFTERVLGAPAHAS